MSLTGTPGTAAFEDVPLLRLLHWLLYSCSLASNTAPLSDRYERPHPRCRVGERMVLTLPNLCLASEKMKQAPVSFAKRQAWAGMTPNSPVSRLCPCQLREVPWLHAQLARPNWAKESQAERPRSFPGELACDRGSVTHPCGEASRALRKLVITHQ